MLIEVFLGEQSSSNEEITIAKIEGNRNLIKVYYSTSNNEDAATQETTTPFLIASMPKSRKPTKFFENGEEVKIGGGNLYIKN